MDIFLSALAIIISLLVFFKDIIIFRRKLSIIISSIEICNTPPNENSDYYTLVIYCILENRNQYPITITKANIGRLEACIASFDLQGDDFHAFGQYSPYKIESIQIPFSLDGFKATGSTAITFLSKEPVYILENNLLEIHTTRGVIKIDISKYLKNATKIS